MEIIKEEVKEVTEDSITVIFSETKTFKLKDLIAEKEKLTGQMDRQREELERIILEKEKRVGKIDLLIAKFPIKGREEEKRKKRRERREEEEFK